MNTMRKAFIKMLKKSQKYTQTDMIYVAHGSFWIGTKKIALILTNLIQTLAFANFISPSTLGSYKFVMALVSTAQSFSFRGFAMATSKAAAHNYDATLSVLFNSMLRWSLIPTIILFATSSYYFLQENTQLGYALAIGACLTGVNISTPLYTNFLSGKKKFQTALHYEFTSLIIRSVAIVITLIYTDNFVILIGIYLGMTAVTNLYFYHRTLKKHVANDLIDSNAKNYGYHLSAMNILGNITAEIDKILIFKFFGAAQLAVYTITLAVPKEMRHLASVVRDLIFPKLATMSLSGIKKKLPHKILIFTILMTLVTILYIFIAPSIFTLIFPQYSEFVLYSQVFSITLIMAAPIVMLNQTFIAHERKKELYVIKTSVPIVRVTLILALLTTYGVWGVIFSTLLSQLANLLLLTFFFYKIPTQDS